MVKRKRGFTIAEVVIALTVILLVAAVCIDMCITAVGVSQKNSNKVSVISASDEFVTCFKDTDNGSDSDSFLNDFNQRLLISLDINDTYETISSNSFTTSGKKTATFSYGIRSLEITLSDGGATYTFISTGYMTVNATVTTNSQYTISVTGYAEGVSSAVCSYDYTK